MRVLVTGGAGFVGSHVADALLAAGHNVVVLDDLSGGKRENVPAKATFERVDIRDAVAVDALFKTFAPEVVSHQAAQASVAVSVKEPLNDARINVAGSLNVLEAARRAGVRLFIFASTGGALYGDVPDGRAASIDWPARPESPYAAAKASVELYLRAYESLYGLPCRVLRYANVYGPRQDPHGEAGVVAIFARRLLAGEPVRINARRASGDDGCVRDYVFVGDVARANAAAIAGTVKVPTFNVGTGIGTTTRELALGIAEAIGVEPQLAFGPRREGDVERSVIDAAEATRTLGALTTLKDGLRETVAWFRAAQSPRP